MKYLVIGIIFILLGVASAGADKFRVGVLILGIYYYFKGIFILIKGEK